MGREKNVDQTENTGTKKKKMKKTDSHPFIFLIGFFPLFFFFVIIIIFVWPTKKIFANNGGLL